MKKIILAVSVFSITILNAQELPKVSPKAKVEQRVGLTDVSITYHRPSVKERVIFGDVVPYNEVWRAGANEATIITFSDDVEIVISKEQNFGPKPLRPGMENPKTKPQTNEVIHNLKSGNYALFITPTDSIWKVHFNSATDSWGSSGYKPENDVLVIEVMPEVFGPKNRQPKKDADGKEIPAEKKPMNPMMKRNLTETLTFSFHDLTDTTAHVVMAWEFTKLSFTVKVDAHQKALANIEKAIKESPKENLWKVYRNAANYMFQGKHDINQALTWIDKAIELNNTAWLNFWIKAQILGEKG
ncbi:MAG: DUF2911 domain-containing protein, partial [Bacteroidia bacterium]